MAKRILYNVGFAELAGGTVNIYSGDADGQPFLAVRKAAASDSKINYMSRDSIVAMLSLNKAFIDSRFDLSMADNAAAPIYTSADSDADGYREIAVTNLNDNIKVLYAGQPFFTMRGDTVEEFAGVSSFSSNSIFDASATAATGSTSLLDQATTFIQANWILVVAMIGAFVYFDPFGLFGKKKKKR